MLAVLAGLAAGLAAAYSVAFVGREGTPWVGSVTKTLSVALLAVLGWMVGVPGWIVAGVALGALGDLALSRPGERAFLAGMAAFAAGHLAYAIGFWRAEVDLVAAGWVMLLAVLAIAGAERWLVPHAGALRWPVRAYAWVIVGMAAVVALLPEREGAGMVWLGAALFVASDLVLAVRMFRVSDPVVGRVLAHLVWPAYWMGQALIVLGSF